MLKIMSVENEDQVGHGEPPKPIKPVPMYPIPAASEK